MIDDMKYVINQVYQRTFNVVVEGFTDKEKLEASKEYINKLKNKYLELGPITEKYFQRILMLEYKEWKGLSLNIRKQILLKDKALEEIVNLTSDGYKWALERINNNSFVSEQIVEEYLTKIEELLPLVKEYNQQLAKWYISEGSIDLIYACGKTDNMSMRIGHYK